MKRPGSRQRSNLEKDPGARIRSVRLVGLELETLLHRHTAITELAEMGVPDSVLKSIAGHIAQRMLEHYSHIRMNAKRLALDGVDAFRAEDALRSLSRADAETVQ